MLWGLNKVWGGKKMAEEALGFLACLIALAIVGFAAAALSPSVEPASGLDGYATSIAIAGEIR